jgi:hypothetical protein
MTGEAWDQPAWADYSGISRTLQQLSESEVDALVTALNEVSQPFPGRHIIRVKTGRAIVLPE